MKEREINLKIELTEGYQRRFTEACCRIFARKNRSFASGIASMENESNGSRENEKTDKQ